jgi:hypothetical protein
MARGSNSGRTSINKSAKAESNAQGGGAFAFTRRYFQHDKHPGQIFCQQLMEKLFTIV